MAAIVVAAAAVAFGMDPAAPRRRFYRPAAVVLTGVAAAN